MNWLIFWIVIYLILILYLTIKHIKVSDVEGYLLNNRNTATLPLVFTTLATFVGGGTSIGLIAMGYEGGFAAMGVGIAYVIGFFILMRYAGKIRDEGKRMNIYSFPGYLIKKFCKEQGRANTRSFSFIVSGINIFIFFFLLSAQFVGMASLLRYTFDIGYQGAAVISCLIVIFYTAIAGMSGVIITDMVQFIVIIIMIIVIFVPGIAEGTEGLTRLSELPREMLNGTHYGLAFLVALPLFIAPSVLVRMDLWQRMLAARSAKVARRTSIISGLGMLPFYIIFPLVGMTIKIISEDSIEPKYAAYFFLDMYSNEFMMGFAVVGLLSALMSSGDSFLNIISISAVSNMGLVFKKKADNGKSLHTNTRIATILFGGIALVMALVLPRIVDLMVVGIATIVIFVPATFVALTREDSSRYLKPAIYSILSGFIVNLGFFFFGLFAPESFELKASFIPAFITSLLVMIIGMSMRSKNIPAT